MLGAVIGVVVTLPATVVSLIGRRDFRNARWGYAIWTLVWLPVVYLGLSGEIERANLAAFPHSMLTRARLDSASLGIWVPLPS